MASQITRAKHREEDHQNPLDRWVLGTCALALAPVALGDDGASSIHSAPQLHVTVDRALIARHDALGRPGQSQVFTDPVVIARHRALGRLGRPTVVTDPALIARHRALGLLPDLSSSGTPRGAAANSSNPFPWKETVIGFAATGRCS